jgi:DNA repair protein RadC
MEDFMYVETRLMTLENSDSIRISKPEEVYALIMKKVKDGEIPSDVESAIHISLDSSYRIIGFHTIGIGDNNCVYFSIKKIFKYTIMDDARYIIEAHTHFDANSTSSRPSGTDIKIAKKINSIAELLDIKVLEQLVISKTGFSIIHLNDDEDNKK